MVRESFGPRRSWRDRLLVWSAGFLVAVLLTLLCVGLASLATSWSLLGESPAAMRTLFIALAAWPLGSAIGVWLARGQPLHGRTLLRCLAATLPGIALLSVPLWLPAVRSQALITLLLAALALLVMPSLAEWGYRWAEPDRRGGRG